MSMAVVLGPHAAAFTLSPTSGYGLLPLVRTSHVGFRRCGEFVALWSGRLGASSRRESGCQQQQRGLRWRIACEATGNGRDFENQASRVAEDARRKANDAAKAFTSKAEEVFENAKRKAAEFQKDDDLKTKLNKLAQAAVRKLEELGYDLRKMVEKWDREYGITEKAQDAFQYASEQVQSIDRQLGAGRKARAITADFRLKWPSYRRQMSAFLETPVGKSAATLFMFWLILSGWLFRLLLLSMWVIPFVPLLLSKIGKAAIVQGNCPNCGMQYVGGRGQVVQCSRCRGVVWQPRTDFSKDSKVDPQIIDIDIDSK